MVTDTTAKRCIGQHCLTMTGDPMHASEVTSGTLECQCSLGLCKQQQDHILWHMLDQYWMCEVHTCSYACQQQCVCQSSLLYAIALLLGRLFTQLHSCSRGFLKSSFSHFSAICPPNRQNTWQHTKQQHTCGSPGSSASQACLYH